MPEEKRKPHERIAEVKRRADAGPAILQNSFRPFFMAAGFWATLAVPLWVLTFFGVITVPDDFDPLLWHQHEMLFGFAAAAICGFLLTAIPNWTGRLPVRGGRLLVLVTLWAMGRVVMLLLPLIGPATTAVLDLAFLTTLSVLIGRELVSGKNWRNLPVLALISLFGLGNWLIHFELLGLADTAAVGIRLSTFVLALLVAVIGGRIVPSFTRNWLVQKGAEALPAAMNSLDKVALLALVLLVIAEVFLPDAKATAGFAVLTGILLGVRLLRWRVWAVRSEPLLWVMHLGYAWLAVGVIMTGLAGLWPTVPPAAAGPYPDGWRLRHDDPGGDDAGVIGPHRTGPYRRSRHPSGFHFGDDRRTRTGDRAIPGRFRSVGDLACGHCLDGGLRLVLRALFSGLYPAPSATPDA